MKAPLDARLAAYAALAGASLAAPTTADAAIVWSGPINLVMPSTVGGVYLNVLTAQTGTSGASVPGWDVNPWGTTVLNFFTPTLRPDGGGEMVGSGTTYFNLNNGSPFIGPASGYTTPGTTTMSTIFPLNLNSSNNFVGFRFTNELTGQINYGWLQLSLGSTVSAQPRTIVSYAYDNQGFPIPVGFIPEPTTNALLLMAAGAVAVRRWRKRRGAA